MRPVLELVERLRRAPERADAELSTFVRAHQFPLLEGDTATFFFWDGQPTEAVHLMHWVFGLESRQAFQRIGGTQAFYLPLELPHAARVEYKLEVRRHGQGHWVRDPHNPRQAFDPFGSNSVCPMPGYGAPAWVKAEPGVRPGQLERFTLRSEVFAEEREVTVYLPNEYRRTKRYPLILCHDGPDYLKYAGVKAVLDNLIHRHEVIPLVVAFTAGGQRNAEYAANPAQARFLVEELLPGVRARFGVTEDPKLRGLMGASFGAVSSLYAAWQHPRRFGRLLLQSGSFVFTDVGRHDRGPLWDPVVDFVNRFRTDPGRVDAQVFMSCGQFESLIYYNRSLVPLLRQAGLSVRFVESPDGHNWINWRDRLRDGLSWLFPGHLRMYYE
ncbi:MAG: esterase family protein [Alphaproteobacteria bacterium]|nr:esterase family protein [Alphaproteobacteria bacterium]